MNRAVLLSTNTSSPLSTLSTCCLGALLFGGAGQRHEPRRVLQNQHKTHLMTCHTLLPPGTPPPPLLFQVRCSLEELASGMNRVVSFKARVESISRVDNVQVLSMRAVQPVSAVVEFQDGDGVFGEQVMVDNVQVLSMRAVQPVNTVVDLKTGTEASETLFQETTCRC